MVAAAAAVMAVGVRLGCVARCAAMMVVQRAAAAVVVEVRAQTLMVATRSARELYDGAVMVAVPVVGVAGGVLARRARAL